MDIASATYDSCSMQSSWSGQLSNCSYDFNYKLPICCLALRGDTSDHPVLTQPFNTSDEIINLLSDPQYAPYFAKNTTLA